MTLMVRDEADIIAAMLEHHRAQGITRIIATDNGSVDGTTEILQRYADEGFVDLRHNPVHDKRQGEAVTAMARDAATLYGADWVLNADADEFWLPTDRSRTLAEVFAEIPTALGSFPVPVIDMIGAPARSGSGLGRLVYRDFRTEDELRAVGLLAHSTHDAAHVGDPEVTVSQGNHFVSIPSTGDPAPELAVEVLHLPWRSWEQYARKVTNAGRAYDASDLMPSPNHHGMRDWRRHQRGVLFSFYATRHPSPAEVEAGLAAGTLIRDDILAAASLPAQEDVLIADEVLDVARPDGREMAVQHTELLELRPEVAELRTRTADLTALEAELRQDRDNLRRVEAELRAQIDTINARRVVRAADWLGTRARRLRGGRG